MPIIANVALTNTFDEWRVITNQTVVALNDILGVGTSGSVLQTYRFITGSEITANSLIVASTNVGGVLNFTTNIANLAFLQANTGKSHANLVLDKVNTALYVANSTNSALTEANTRITAAFLQANASLYVANTSNDNITTAFLKANQVGAAVTTANATITLAYNQANAALYVANSSNGTMVSINATALGAFTLANSLAVAGGADIGISAFNQANLISYVANTHNGALTEANTRITAAFLQANTGLYVANSTNGALTEANTRITAAFLKANQTGAAVDTANTSMVMKTGNTMSGNLVMSSANIAFTMSGTGITSNLGVYWAGSTQGTTTSILVRESSALVFSTASTERMRITAAGITGIGTSVPDSGSKLDVSGAIKSSSLALGASPIASTSAPLQITGDISFLGSNRSILGNMYYTTGYYYGGNGYGWGFREDGSGKLQMLWATNNLSGLGAAASPSQTDLFTFDLVNKYVGLGTGSPSAKLHVVGDIYHTGGSVGVGTASPAATLDVVGTFSVARASVLSQTLTDGATISWDTSLGQVATVTLGGNRTFAVPSNLKVGTYILHVIQDATGGRTITWPSTFKWSSGVYPTLSTTGGRRDVFSFVSDGTNLYGAMIPDVR